jgi:hypothetical protein
MISKEKIKTGDIGIVTKPHTFLGKLIGLFTHNCSHSFAFCWEFNDLYVYEMKGFGIYRTLFDFSDYNNDENWILRTPVNPYSKLQQDRFIRINELFFNQKITYDIDTLFRDFYFIALDRYPVERRKDNSFVCSQLSALAANYAAPFTFVLPESITPYDFFISKNYITIKN